MNIQLYDTAGCTFTAYGMRINRRLKSLICLECKAVVLPQNVKPHLAKLHPGHKLRINEDLILATAAAEGVITTWPELPSKGIPVQYEGLICKVGVRCTDCRNMYSKARTMKEHVRKVHHHSVSPSTPLRHNLMQRLSNHPEANSWFPVYGREILSPSFPDHQYLSELRKQLDERPPLSAEDIDHRHLSPYIYKPVNSAQGSGGKWWQVDGKGGSSETVGSCAVARLREL